MHEKGVTRAVFVESLKKAGCSVSESQLDRWVAALNARGTAIKEDKKTGSLPSLDREWRDVASGWVLHENEHGDAVTLEAYMAFVLDYLKTEISKATASKYLEEDGFASRLAKKKKKSFVVDIDALRKAYWDWVFIQDFRARRINRSKFASIDFTFSGHRTDRITTFAPKGGPQPMVTESISNFTNCIITVEWADGENKTEPMLFTYNSAFREDRNPTKKRSAQVTHLHECMDKYGIVKERIVYMGSDKNETRTYVRESPDLVRHFFGHYGVPPDTTIYSDEGNSFFEERNSVLLELGFAKHIRYPAKVHQYISVNDNPLHGSSKQKWRKCGVDFSDDVDSCLALLNFLDKDIGLYSKYWWDRNMILVTQEGVNELIGEGPVKLSHLHKHWKRSYEEFMKENDAE